MTVKSVGPQRVSDAVGEGEAIDLIDVRTAVEFAEVHAGAAESVPLDQLNPAAVLATRKGRSGTPIYLICKGGTRGAKACERFMTAGFAEVYNVAGGTDAWVAAGLPVVRGRKGMSLERQVRIAAGWLVLVGVVLGFLVHRAFFGLSGFVGAGLVFAGVTDFCGMGLLLARMPWNRR